MYVCACERMYLYVCLSIYLLTHICGFCARICINRVEDAVGPPHWMVECYATFGTEYVDAILSTYLLDSIFLWGALAMADWGARIAAVSKSFAHGLRD